MMPPDAEVTLVLPLGLADLLRASVIAVTAKVV